MVLIIEVALGILLAMVIAALVMGAVTMAWDSWRWETRKGKDQAPKK